MAAIASPFGVLRYGTRDAKLTGCHLQRAAWERMLRLMMPLCVEISPPLPVEVRSRGEITAQKGIEAREKKISSTGEVSAERKLARLAERIVLESVVNRM